MESLLLYRPSYYSLQVDLKYGRSIKEHNTNQDKWPDGFLELVYSYKSTINLSKVINMDLATFNYKCFYIIK